MNIPQYIDSGVLELYVLQRLSPEEQAEVARNAAAHPEIAAEIRQIEQALEELTLTLAPDVSPDVLARTLQTIRNRRTDTGTGSPAPPLAGERGSSTRWLPWGIAVAGIAMAASFWQSHQRNTEQLATLQVAYDELQDNCAATARQQATDANILATLADPDTRNIILDGTEIAPDKRAVVFYNTTAAQTLFTASNLPEPPAGKQYQLWAIDAGGPKSLGVLERDLDGAAILSVDFVPEVAAFAITLEDEGGKPAPDLTQLQVIGKVS